MKELKSKLEKIGYEAGKALQNDEGMSLFV
jgi:hypothetical protein